MTDEELAQWLKGEVNKNFKTLGDRKGFMTIDEYDEDELWLLTARELQKKLNEEDEKIIERLYDINRRISLNCIAWKKNITPSQAKIINLALGDIIKDLRKSHFLKGEER